MSETESKLIHLKYASPQIANLNINAWANVLMLKIHVITGWALPITEELETVLVDQLSKKLLEDYAQLNVDEIEYAFRSIGTTVKDWGKSMNLTLVDEVLRPYVAQRFEASQLEERLKQKPRQRIYTEEELDNFHREDVEAFYQRCLKGILPPAELPDYYRKILVKDGYITEDSDDLHAFFAYWIGKGYKNIYKKE